MKILIIMISKCISFIGGLLNRGSSLPGYVALKLDKMILSKLKLPENTIVVTGTNGKTSTSNYIATVLEADGKTVVHNSSGANMLQGIVSIILKNVTLAGTLKKDYLVLEVDEAYVKEISHGIKPKYMVVTNIFEDQVDRFATLAGVQDLILTGIVPETTLILNADDPYVKQLADVSGNSVIYFGIDYHKSDAVINENCPVCNSLLKYDHQYYNHLGMYQCQCGFSYPNDINYRATDIDLKEKTFKVSDEAYHLNNGALYITYNMLAAISVCCELGIASTVIDGALRQHSVGMGRMETLYINHHDTFLNLVKNAAGLNQTLSYIDDLESQSFNLFLSVHSREPDSDNIEWLHDTQLDLLKDERLNLFVLAGDEAERVADLYRRHGIEDSKLKVIESVDEGINVLLNDDVTKVYFLANYSSLNEVRQKLLSHQNN